jgi:hypothetical protein
LKANTITTLGELRDGDRFVFQGKNEVWEVTGNPSNGYVPFNQFVADGVKKNRHDDLKKINKDVKFLRHTKPLEGEEWALKDLKVGAVFCRPTGNITHEYRLIENKYPHAVVKCVMITENINIPIDFPGNEKGIYLRTTNL